MVTHWASCARVAPVASIEQQAWIRRSARDVQVDGEMRTTDLPVATKFHQDFIPLMQVPNNVTRVMLVLGLTSRQVHAIQVRTHPAEDLFHALTAVLVLTRLLLHPKSVILAHQEGIKMTPTLRLVFW